MACGKPAFEVYLSNRSGEFRWRLRASNGKIVAVSSEGYKRKVDMLDALRFLKDTSERAESMDVQIKKSGPLKRDVKAKPKAKAKAKAKAGKVRKAPRKARKAPPKARKAAPKVPAPAPASEAVAAV